MRKTDALKTAATRFMLGLVTESLEKTGQFDKAFTGYLQIFEKDKELTESRPPSTKNSLLFRESSGIWKHMRIEQLSI